MLKSDVDSCFQSVSNGKALLASTLTGLGVTTASDATFATINTNITTLANNKYNSGYTAGAASVDTSGTATEADIVKDKTAIVNGRRLTGTLDTQTYYNNGYTAGAASVDTQSYYDSGYTAGVESVNKEIFFPELKVTSTDSSNSNQYARSTIELYTSFYTDKASTGTGLGMRTNEYNTLSIDNISISNGSYYGGALKIYGYEYQEFKSYNVITPGWSEGTEIYNSNSSASNKTIDISPYHKIQIFFSGGKDGGSSSATLTNVRLYNQ